MKTEPSYTFFNMFWLTLTKRRMLNSSLPWPNFWRTLIVDCLLVKAKFTIVDFDQKLQIWLLTRFDFSAYIWLDIGWFLWIVKALTFDSLLMYLDYVSLCWTFDDNLIEEKFGNGFPPYRVFPWSLTKSRVSIVLGCHLLCIWFTVLSTIVYCHWIIDCYWKKNCYKVVVTA